MHIQYTNEWHTLLNNNYYYNWWLRVSTLTWCQKQMGWVAITCWSLLSIDTYTYINKPDNKYYNTTHTSYNFDIVIDNCINLYKQMQMQCWFLFHWETQWNVTCNIKRKKTPVQWCQNASSGKYLGCWLISSQGIITCKLTHIHMWHMLHMQIN